MWNLYSIALCGSLYLSCTMVTEHHWVFLDIVLCLVCESAIVHHSRPSERTSRLLLSGSDMRLSDFWPSELRVVAGLPVSLQSFVWRVTRWWFFCLHLLHISSILTLFLHILIYALYCIALYTLFIFNHMFSAAMKVQVAWPRVFCL